MKTKIKKIVCMALCLTMLVGTITVVPKAITAKAEDGTTEDSTYTNLTFADFGMADGLYGKNGDVYKCKDTTITSLDKVAINGKLKIHSEKQELRFQLGNTIVANIGVWNKDLKVNLQSLSGSSTDTDKQPLVTGYSDNYGQEVSFRIEFEQKTEKVEVRYFIDGTCKYTQTVSDKSLAGTPKIRLEIIGAPNNMTLTSVYKGYEELTFSDFGLADGTLAKTSTYTTNKVSSLDGCAIVGTLSVDEKQKEVTFGNGLTNIGYYNGPKLKVSGSHYVNGSASNDEEALIDSYTLETEVKLRVNFKKSDNKVVIRTYVDGILKVVQTRDCNTKTLDAKIVSNEKITFKSVQKETTVTDEKFDTGYTELTFADFGMEDGTYATLDNSTLSKRYQCTNKSITSYDKVAVSGKLSLLADQTELRFMYGSNEDNILANIGRWNSGLKVNPTYIAIGSDEQLDSTYTLNTEVLLRVTFDKTTDEKIKVTYFIDGEEKYSQTATKDNVTTEYVPTIMVQSNQKVNNAMKLTSVYKNYKTLTFSDWGYTDEFPSATPHSLKNEAITSLHGYAFEGIVDFKGNNYEKAALKIGGTKGTEEKAFNLTVAQDTLKYTNVAQEDEKTVSISGIENDYHALRLGFDEVTENNWMVRIWVDGEHVISTLLKDTELGTYMVVLKNSKDDGNNFEIQSIDRTDIEADKTVGYTVEAEAKDVKVDGEEFAGNQYTTIGEHKISYTLFGMEITRNMVIYGKGDANADDTTDIKDLVRAKKYVVNFATPNKTQLLGADFGEDNKIKNDDVITLRMLLAKGQATNEDSENLLVSLSGPSSDLFARHAGLC